MSKQIIKGLSHLKIQAVKGKDGKDGKDAIPPSKDELVSLITPLIPKSIQGDEGSQGEKGEKGEAGIKGEKGEKGDTGTDGNQGIQGEKGNDGSPDTPDTVLEKVNKSSKLVDAERVRGLSKVIRDIEKIGTNPIGGGGKTVRFLDDGTEISAHVTELNFSTGLTPTYNGNGRITLESAGGSYTDEQAQDAVGAMIDTTLVYTDLTPSLVRAALTGNVTAPEGSNATTIANDVVSNAMLVNMGDNTIKGRPFGSGTGDPQDLTSTQATVLINVATTSLKGLMNPADKTKLDGIATGATANSTDAVLLDRSNHTGTQLASTISDFAATVRSTVLTGLSLVSVTVISATDTLLVALGSLQAQITALTTTVSGKVDTTRSISTTAPLSGGGDLSANRTLTTSMNTNKLIGRSTAAVGVMEEITLGTNLSFTGTTLNAAGGGSSTVQDEGVTQSTAVTTFNFTGAGVTASGAGATATINIPGGAGGDLALSKNILSANTTVTAEYSAYIPYFAEIADTFTLEVGLGSYLEIG